MSKKDDKDKLTVPIRIVISQPLYDRLKEQCHDHGDISKLVRKLLSKYLDMMEAAN